MDDDDDSCVTTPQRLAPRSPSSSDLLHTLGRSARKRRAPFSRFRFSRSLLPQNPLSDSFLDTLSFAPENQKDAFLKRHANSSVIGSSGIPSNVAQSMLNNGNCETASLACVTNRNEQDLRRCLKTQSFCSVSATAENGATTSSAVDSSIHGYDNFLPSPQTACASDVCHPAASSPASSTCDGQCNSSFMRSFTPHRRFENLRCVSSPLQCTRSVTSLDGFSNSDETDKRDANRCPSVRSSSVSQCHANSSNFGASTLETCDDAATLWAPATPRQQDAVCDSLNGDAAPVSYDGSCSPFSTPCLRQPSKSLSCTPAAPLRVRRTQSLLLQAVLTGRVSDVQQALNNDEDPNDLLRLPAWVTGTVETMLPLLAAAWLVDPDVLCVLLDNGAVVNSVTSEGKNALHLVFTRFKKDSELAHVSVKSKTNGLSMTFQRLGSFFDGLADDSAEQVNSLCVPQEDADKEEYEKCLSFTPPKFVLPSFQVTPRRIITISDVVACGELLLRYGLDASRRDVYGKTPLDYVLDVRELPFEHPFFSYLKHVASEAKVDEVSEVNLLSDACLME